MSSTDAVDTDALLDDSGPDDVIAEPPGPAEPVPVGKRLSVRIVLAVVAAVLCLLAAPMVIWQARLEAPQYKGKNALHIRAYQDRMVGDICELNDLNHYIGMRPLGDPDPPCGSIEQARMLQEGAGNHVGRIADEMVLWIPSVVLAAIAAVAAMLSYSVTNKSIRRLLRWGGVAFMWLVPVGVLFMTQVHLYDFGHDLDPTSAFHPKPFTPRVLGPSRIYQFDVDARPGRGLWFVIGAAALVTFGPWLVTKLAKWIPEFMRWLGGWVSWMTGKSSTTSAMSVVLAVMLATTALSWAGSPPTSAQMQQRVTSPQQSAAGLDVHRRSVEAATPKTDGDSSDGARTRGAQLEKRLESAAPGDTIVIGAGTYEGHFVVSTRVTIVGEDRPVLDGAGNGSTLTIAEGADGTSVTGLRLSGSASGPSGSPAGLFIEADDVVVDDVEVVESYMGIRALGADRLVVRNSRIEGFSEGVFESELHATGDDVDFTGIQRIDLKRRPSRMRGDGITVANAYDAVVENNEIVNTRDGIYLTYASRTLLSANQIIDGRYGLHSMYADELTAVDNYLRGNLSGFVLMYGEPFELRHNTIIESISPATGIGVVLKDVSLVTLVDNIIAANRVGLKVDNAGATGNSEVPVDARSNTIGMNQVGVELATSANVVFTENSFVENTVQVVVDGKVPRVAWNRDGVGNFWSNYKGYDISGNGIGDVPFIQGGSIARTLTKSPVMISLASGPGFRIMQAIEDRWAPEQPVAVDEFPLMEKRSPSVPESLRPGSPPAWFALTSAAIALVGGLILLLGRRTQRSLGFTRG